MGIEVIVFFFDGWEDPKAMIAQLKDMGIAVIVAS